MWGLLIRHQSPGAALLRLGTEPCGIAMPEPTVKIKQGLTNAPSATIADELYSGDAVASVVAAVPGRDATAGPPEQKTWHLMKHHGCVDIRAAWKGTQ